LAPGPSPVEASPALSAADQGAGREEICPSRSCAGRSLQRGEPQLAQELEPGLSAPVRLSETALSSLDLYVLTIHLMSWAVFTWAFLKFSWAFPSARSIFLVIPCSCA
jgi:hypothetical protein